MQPVEEYINMMIYFFSLVQDIQDSGHFVYDYRSLASLETQICCASSEINKFSFESTCLFKWSFLRVIEPVTCKVAQKDTSEG